MGCCCPGLRNDVTPIKAGNGQKAELIGQDQNGSCRDVVFLLIFIVFLGGMFYVAYLGLSLGNPNRLVYGVDSWGNICGKKNNEQIGNVPLSGKDVSNEQHLFYYDKNAFVGYEAGSFIKRTKVAVCVSFCPNSTLSTNTDLRDFSTSTGSRLCRYGVPLSSYTGGSADALGDCPPLPIEQHESILFRCIPKSAKAPYEILTGAINGVFNKIDENFSRKCLSDLESTWKEIIYLSIIAVGVSLVMVILLRFIAFIVIWLMVATMAVGSITGTVICWFKYSQLREELGTDSKVVENWLIGSIVATVVTVLILLLLLIMRKRIALVVQLFKEAGKAVASMPFLLLQPFLTVAIICSILVLVGFTFISMESAGRPEVSNSTGFVSFVKEDSVKYLRWYHIFGAIWIIQFVLACERIALAGAVGEWYFNRDIGLLDFPILKSTGRLIRFHLGSAAFGSFLIALVSFINMILTFIHNRLKNRSGECAAFLTKCLCCCFWCFEKLLKFLNSNAYIEIAILGFGFCKAARQAFIIIVGNALRMAAINSVGNFTLFMGKVGCVSVVAVVGIELMATRPDVFYTWLPITLSCIIAYIIASCFLGVYELCIDTIFICFCEDCDRNNGKDRPYAMSVGLLKFVRDAEGAKSGVTENYTPRNEQSRKV